MGANNPFQLPKLKKIPQASGSSGCGGVSGVLVFFVAFCVFMLDGLFSDSNKSKTESESQVDTVQSVPKSDAPVEKVADEPTEEEVAYTPISYDLVKRCVGSNISRSRVRRLFETFNLNLICEKNDIRENEYNEDYNMDRTDAWVTYAGGEGISITKNANHDDDIMPASSNAHGLLIYGFIGDEDNINSTRDFNFFSGRIIFADEQEMISFDQEAKRDGCTIDSDGRLFNQQLFVWFTHSMKNGKHMYSIDVEH